MLKKSRPSHQPSAKEMRARAEASLKRREEQKIDGPKAMREYRDAEQAVRDRTARLRAERLARHPM